MRPAVVLWFLFAALLGALLLIHFNQPERPPIGGSRSPAHQAP